MPTPTKSQNTTVIGSHNDKKICWKHILKIPKYSTIYSDHLLNRQKHLDILKKSFYHTSIVRANLQLPNGQYFLLIQKNKLVDRLKDKLIPNLKVKISSLVQCSVCSLSVHNLNVSALSSCILTTFLFVGIEF